MLMDNLVGNGSPSYRMEAWQCVNKSRVKIACKLEKACTAMGKAIVHISEIRARPTTIITERIGKNKNKQVVVPILIAAVDLFWTVPCLAAAATVYMASLPILGLSSLISPPKTYKTAEFFVNNPEKIKSDFRSGVLPKVFYDFAHNNRRIQVKPNIVNSNGVSVNLAVKNFASGKSRTEIQSEFDALQNQYYDLWLKSKGYDKSQLEAKRKELLKKLDLSEDYIPRDLERLKNWLFPAIGETRLGSPSSTQKEKIKAKQKAFVILSAILRAQP